MKFLQKRRLVVDQKHLSSQNNEQLSIFMYGLYQDNVLSYLMRINDMKMFEYILQRGISPLSSNHNELNALHYAIQLEKLNFLAYLLEGDFEACNNKSTANDVIEAKSRRLEGLLNDQSRTEKKYWIFESLVALDRFTLNEGYTPLILSMKAEKEEMASYIIQIIMVRERLRTQSTISQTFKSKFVHIDDLLSYKDKKSKTALLTSARSGFISSFKQLFALGANFYVTCGKLNNALHYANMSENEDLVKFVSWSDAENSSGYYLHNQRNVRGMLPIDYDRKKRFYDIVYHIWESASLSKN